MSSSNLVSVIIPVYNAARTIERCLHSVIEQSYKSLEIVIVDDGSADDSIRIVNEMGKKDNRIKVIEKENEGVSATRNRGIDAAVGEYILFIDSDDYIQKNYIEHLVYELENKEADIATTGYTIEKDSKNHKNLIAETVECYIGEDYLRKILDFSRQASSLGFVHSKLYRRSLISDDLRFPVGINCGEDNLFNIKYLSKAQSIVVLPYAEYIYTIGKNESLSNKYAKDLINVLRDSFAVYRDLYIEKDRFELYKSTILYYGYIIVRNCVSNYLSDNCHKYKDAKTYIRSVLVNDDIHNAIMDCESGAGVDKVLLSLLRKKHYSLFLALLSTKKIVKQYMFDVFFLIRNRSQREG